MKRRARHAVTLTVVALGLRAILSPGYAQQIPSDSATGLIVGQVVDSERRPVARATVSLGGPPGANGVVDSRRSVLTDEQGEFVFTGLGAGQYDLAASKSGYADGRYGRRRPGGSVKPLSLDRADRRTDITITVWRRAAITGRVTDESGAALVGASVSALEPTNVAGYESLQSINSAMTDDRGAYRIAGLLPGEYAIVCRVHEPITLGDVAGRTSKTTAYVYTPKYYPAQTDSSAVSTLTLAAGQELDAVDFTMTPMPAARVSGRVVGSTILDAPASRPNVSLLGTPPGAPQFRDTLPSFSTTTDAQGRFAFEAVPAGPYQLRVIERPPEQIGPRPPQTTTVTQTPWGTVTSGGSLPGQPQTPAPISTDPTWWATQSIAIGSVDQNDVVLSMQPSARLTGHLQFDGASSPPTAEMISHAAGLVSAHAADRGYYELYSPRTAMTPDGNFTVAGITPGRYVMRAGWIGPWRMSRVMLNGRDVSAEPLEVGAKDIDGVVVVFSDRSARVTGTVRDASGQPDEDAAVFLFPSDSRQWIDYGPSSPRIYRVNTRPRGIYEFTDILPGEYFVVATSQALGPVWQSAWGLTRLSRTALITSVVEGGQSALDLRTQAIVK